MDNMTGIDLGIITIGLGVPFLSFVIIFCWLTFFNRKTTGEIKFILPPDVFLKVMAVIIVVAVTFLLTFYKIMGVEVTAAILGSVVTGAITSIKKSEEKSSGQGTNSDIRINEKHINYPS